MKGNALNTVKMNTTDEKPLIGIYMSLRTSKYKKKDSEVLAH